METGTSKAAQINEETNKIIFVGPARCEFKTFIQQTEFYLNTYCWNWKNYQEPESYLFPPVFYYANAHLGDEDYETYSSSKNINKGEDGIVKQRGADQSEHWVHEAIYQLAQEKFQAPFIAVHGMNLDSLKPYWDKLFPEELNLQEFNSCLREYDYVLIGPKIGIINIEVKGSHFTQKKYFAEKYKFLPRNYVEGLNQLETINILVQFLAAYTYTPFNTIEIRKIIFTPNLSRERYDKWFKSLDEAVAGHVKKMTDGIIQWFTEDMENTDRDRSKPKLYSTLQKLLSDAAISKTCLIYETYGPIITGFSSMLILKDKQVTTITRQEIHLSELATTLEEGLRVESQDPLGYAKKATRFRADFHGFLSQLLLLTPEQQTALNGPPQQLILGAAGTGKTVILHAKALQLLRQEKSVSIYSTDDYSNRYKALFSNHGFDDSNKITLNSWTNYLRMVEQFGFEFGVDSLFEHSPTEIFQLIGDKKRSARLVRVLDYILKKSDCVLIDDTLDQKESTNHAKFRECSFGLSLVLVAYAREVFPEKTVWIALDSYIKHGIRDDGYLKYKNNLQELIERGQYYCSTLKRIMRCSEKVFNRAFDSEILNQIYFETTLGHKIQGSQTIVRIPCDNYKDGSKLMWEEIYCQLIKLRQSDNDFRHVVVITHNYDLCEYIHKQCGFQGILAAMPNQVSSGGLHLNNIGKELSHEELEKKLLIYPYYRVSSLEWPVVIYVGFEGTQSNDTYARYLACSRATSQLIEIILSVNSTSEKE